MSDVDAHDGMTPRFPSPLRNGSNASSPFLSCVFLSLTGLGTYRAEHRACMVIELNAQ